MMTTLFPEMFHPYRCGTFGFDNGGLPFKQPLLFFPHNTASGRPFFSPNIGGDNFNMVPSLPHFFFFFVFSDSLFFFSFLGFNTSFFFATKSLS